MAILALVGESGSGKSTIEQILEKKCGFKRIISYTTRKPRDKEVNNVDYHFVNDEYFISNEDYFAEIEEYEGNRKYGTMISSYQGDNDKVVVLTPNGVRTIKKKFPEIELFVVYITAPLKDRCIRYINRCKDFKDTDLIELNNRSQRDWGMFRGFKNEADITIKNSNNHLLTYVAFILDYFNDFKNKHNQKTKSLTKQVSVNDIVNFIFGE